jgi:two-component system response regulator GlrR
MLADAAPRAIDCAPVPDDTRAKGPLDTLPVADVRPDLVSQFRLTVLGGDDAGRVFDSTGDRLVIGTHETADVRISDPTVSQLHCELVVEAGQVRIRDLGSRNGTVVNGVRVLDAEVPGDAVLTLGRTEIKFDLGVRHVTVPLYAGDSFGVLVGASRPMRAVFARLEQAARTDSTVLLTGETGTGKELAAQAIHEASGRNQGPLVVIDCGAIPAELLESELFGHERGAFTGAVQARAGAFEEADGGTIFLDEIGELPAAFQPKFLRVLEQRRIKRIGTNRYEPVNVRVIAATNRDLYTQVNTGSFRSDLYYRLAVLTIHLPPLRERRDDIPRLIARIAESLGEDPSTIPASFLEDAARRSWPGNVRELRNYVERFLAFHETAPEREPEPATITIDELADHRRPLKKARLGWTQVLERRYVEKLLAEHDGNVTRAAKAAKIDRMYLYRLLRRTGIRPAPV